MENESSDNNQKIKQFISMLTANQIRIYSYILMRVPCLSDAEDIMQDATSTMWEKFHEFEPGTDFIAWSLTIARFKILNFRRKRAKFHPWLNDDVIQKIDSNSSKLISQQDYRLDALKLCLGKLSDMSSQIIQMRYAKELSVQIIADHFNKSVPFIYKSISKVHQMLLGCVRNRLAGEDV